MTTRKVRQLTVLIVLVLSLFSLSLFGYMIVKTWGYQNTGSKTLLSNDFYSLKQKATDQQIEAFKQLSKALSGTDDSVIAEDTAISFVYEFFTWSNSTSATDIGGLQYVADELRANVYTKALDTYAHDMAYYAQTDQLADTYTVDSVSATSSQANIRYNSTVSAGYQVRCNWTYGTGRLSTTGMPTEAVFELIKNDAGRWAIVRMDMEEA